jgi:hypothetical protein
MEPPRCPGRRKKPCHGFYRYHLGIGRVSTEWGYILEYAEKSCNEKILE